jgi:CBS domain containing-hemolysin-like protein
LNAILLAALLAQIGAATVAGLLAERWFGGIAITIASVVLTLVLFVYSEAIPKTFAVRYPDRVALTLSYPIRLLELVLRPLVGVLVWFADLQAPGKGVATSPTVTELELRSLAAEAAREGQITPLDRERIERAFAFGDRVVSEIMVPRVDIVAVAGTTPVRDAIATALRSGHRRIPIHDGNVDHITAMASLRDLIVLDDTTPDAPVEDAARPVLAVPESKRITELLRTMQEQGTHITIVVDEYGGTAGLVTIEDIVEELLGTVAEEDPAGRGRMFRALPGGSWLVDGRMSVDDLGHRLGAELPDGPWTTVAGLVIGLIGRVPAVNDEVVTAGHRFRVTAATRRRIRRVEVSPVGPGRRPPPGKWERDD